MQTVQHWLDTHHFLHRLVEFGGVPWMRLNHQWHGINMLSVLECALLAMLLCAIMAGFGAFIRRSRRLTAIALAGTLSFATAAYAANTQLSLLTSSGALAGANLLYVVQSAGSGGVKATFTQVATFINSLFSGDCTATSGGALSCTKFNGGTAFASAAGAASGTSGHTLPFLDGTNTFSGTQTFGSVVGAINTQVGTTYTLATTDCGKTVLITNASAITLTTLNSIPAGCAISVEQGGAGQITVANGAGATLTSAHSFTKTFNAAGAIIGLFVDTNAGAAAHFVLTGDGA